MKSYVEKNSTRKILKDILPLDMPLGLCFEPTNLCNFKCRQCPVSREDFGEIVGGRQLLELDLFKKVMNDVKEMGHLKNLNLYGDGEPLLNKHIFEMIQYAREIDVVDNITITTNGALLDEKISEKLLNTGLTYLRISIYSVNQDTFKEITRAKVDAETVYENVKRFVEMRNAKNQEHPFVYVKMIDTYTEENEIFKEKYTGIADQVNIERPMNWNGFNGIDLIGKIDKDHKTDETLQQGFYASSKQSGFKQICTTAFHSLNIKSNGDVTICIVDWNKGTKVGNLKEESLSDIWFGKNLRDFRNMHICGEKHKNESCKNCKYMYSNPDNIDGQPQEFYDRILNHKRKS